MSDLFDMEVNGYSGEVSTFITPDLEMQLDVKQKIGFEIGFDQAFYRQPLSDRSDSAITQGFESCMVRSDPEKIDRFVKKWLQLRFQAYLRERSVSMDVTPKLIKALDTPTCPITGLALTHASLEPTDWSIERLCNESGYAWGNLAIVCTKANQSRGSMTYEDICNVADSNENFNGLSSQSWLCYKNLARGPNFWAGKTKGIIPLSIPLNQCLIFIMPSQFLQELAYLTGGYHGSEMSKFAYKALKMFNSKGSSQAKLSKFLNKVERNLKKGHNRHQTFSNPSCFDSFLDWYESTDFTLDGYLGLIGGQRNWSLGLGKNQPVGIDAPGRNWFIPTNGYLT